MMELYDFKTVIVRATCEECDVEQVVESVRDWFASHDCALWSLDIATEKPTETERTCAQQDCEDHLGVEGQDREAYSDDQDRESYIASN